MRIIKEFCVVLLALFILFMSPLEKPIAIIRHNSASNQSGMVGIVV